MVTPPNISQVVQKSKTRKAILKSLCDEGIYPGAMIVSKRFIEGTIESLDTTPPSFMKIKLNGERFHLFHKGKSSKTIYFRENTMVMFLDVVFQIDARGHAYYHMNVLHGDNIVTLNHTPLDASADLGITSFLGEWKQL